VGLPFFVCDDNVSTADKWLALPVVFGEPPGGPVVACGDAVFTVGNDAADVERRLSSALLACPGCGGRLAPWGHGRSRVLRRLGRFGWRLRPRRARCSGCGATHILLPVSCLVRRADVVGVIGEALVCAARGWGHRRIAERLDRPTTTVRGWLRRFNSRAGPLRSAFTVLLGDLAPDPRVPESTGSELADAVSAIVAAAAAVVVRWGRSVFTLSPWWVAAAVTAGRLLAPGTAIELINTSRPW
jgi:hypothetical protein